MSLVKASLLSAFVAAVVTAAGLHVLHRHRAQEAGQLRRANQQMRQQVLARHAAARTDSPRPDDVSTAEAVAGSSARVAAASAGDYRNEGQATPLATLQTFAWACDRGDAGAMARLICFDDAARTKAEEFRASLPAETRARWSTLDAMAAELLVGAGMRQPFPSARILATATIEPVSEGRVRLRLPNTPKDRTEYQKVGDDWRYVVTEAMVERYLAHVRSESRRAR